MISIREFNKSHLAPESTIIQVADDALYHINDALASSKQTRSDFITKYSDILQQYELEIVQLDQEVAKIPPSLASLIQSKKTKKKERASQRTSRSRLGLSGVGPPGLRRSKGSGTGYQSSDNMSVASSRVSSKRTGSNSEEALLLDKLQARSLLFQQISTMREYELQFERKLACDGTRSMSDVHDIINMTEQERRETTAALLRLQTSNSEKIVEMITTYKPRITHALPKAGASSGRSSLQQLHVQSVQDIVDEAQAQASPLQANINSDILEGIPNTGKDPHPQVTKQRRDTGMELPVPKNIRTTCDRIPRIDEALEEEDDGSEYKYDFEEFA
mmetsp:Transcript_27270/g.54980  ORF Transcript_27270/g.54980 Transcript_27270/m.54980 type:complete len:332 (+) Transcript_27270:3426-4421(+)